MGPRAAMETIVPENYIDLVELAVVLAASPNDPSIINPDFLQRYGIVDSDLASGQPSIATPAFSQVHYAVGLSVVSTPDRIVFSQLGTPLIVDAIVSPEMAERYATTVPHVNYTGVGINPKVFKTLEELGTIAISDALRDQGEGIELGSALPEVQIKAIYNDEDRIFVFDVQEIFAELDGEQIRGILFQANVHRDLPQGTRGENIKGLTSILSRWPQDLSDFYGLIDQFRRSYMTP